MFKNNLQLYIRDIESRYLFEVFICFLVALVEFLGKHPRGKMYARDQMSAPIAVPCLAISTMEREPQEPVNGDGDPF